MCALWIKRRVVFSNAKFRTPDLERGLRIRRSALRNEERERERERRQEKIIFPARPPLFVTVLMIQWRCLPAGARQGTACGGPDVKEQCDYKSAGSSLQVLFGCGGV